MALKRRLKNFLKRSGIHVRLQDPDVDLKRRLKLLSHYSINKVFDIGANTGDYAINMRDAGYIGKVISFEPLSSAYSVLSKACSNDKNWESINMAIGSRDEETFINIAGNSQSSSLLDMLPEHVKSAPSSAYIGKEKITVRKMDTIFNQYYGEGDHILLKIDTQGFEKQVLDGAEQSLSKITGIQLEMSLIPLYANEMLYLEMIAFLKGKGFILMSIENGFANPTTGQLLQVDGLFFR